MIDVVGYGGQLQHQFSGMHDSKGMSAAQGARMSPGNSLHTLQPVPQEIHTSVIKKTFNDHSVETIVPNLKTNSGFESNCFPEQSKGGRDTSKDDAQLDDDFSDHDSHYSEDFEDIDEDLQPQPDMTKQLLTFADMVNTDIQKFFGRKKGEEDSCDIYEDKWIATKSGRELYYADLMKIVQGEDKVSKKRPAASPLLDISSSVKESQDNRNMFSGKLDRKLGIGPLSELFEYGLRHFLAEKKNKTKELKRLKSDNRKFNDVTPMNTRKFPTSFWREPGSQSSDTRSHATNSVLQSNNPPDFSDLLESWRLDRNEFNGDLSSSEVSMSPESV